MKIYYVRHAETIQNTLERWSSVPVDMWPADLHKDRSHLSRLGELQARALAPKLRQYSFDTIFVSPLWRALETIQPYLEATDQRAIVWPELREITTIGEYAECSRDQIGTVGLPEPSPDFFEGEPIVLSQEQQSRFVIETGSELHTKIGSDIRQGSADVTQMLRSVQKRLFEQQALGRKSILLVGHAISGRFLLWLLTGKDQIKQLSIENTKLWMVESFGVGTCALRMFNDEPHSM